MPAFVVRVVLTVSVELVAAGFGEKPAVAFPGTPLTANVTGALNPPLGVTVIP